ncbi:MAG: hypothetical protein NVS3B20_19350 [Polyangiales bacterium]
MSVMSASCAGPSLSPRDAGADGANPDAPDAVTDSLPSEPSDALEEKVALRLRGCRGVENGCHGNPGARGLQFGNGPSRDLAALINVPSSERPDWFLVRPKKPEVSWLVAKLRNAKEAGVEAPMPLGSQGDPAFAAVVEEWILAGASNGFADAAAE